MSFVSPKTPQMNTGYRYSFNCKPRPFKDVVAEGLKNRIEFASYYDDDVQSQFEYWVNNKSRQKKEIGKMKLYLLKHNAKHNTRIVGVVAAKNVEDAKKVYSIEAELEVTELGYAFDNIESGVVLAK